MGWVPHQLVCINTTREWFGFHRSLKQSVSIKRAREPFDFGRTVRLLRLLLEYASWKIGEINMPLHTSHENRNASNEAPTTFLPKTCQVSDNIPFLNQNRKDRYSIFKIEMFENISFNTIPNVSLRPSHGLSITCHPARSIQFEKYNSILMECRISEQRKLTHFQWC